MLLPSLVTLCTLTACAAGSALPKDRVDARGVRSTSYNSTSIVVSSSASSSAISSSSSSSTSLVVDTSCSNTALNRACWGDGYNIATDFDTKWPNTGNTITYSLDITNTTLAPDGTERMVLAVNGQYPGPTIYANWGDMLEITVTNSMKDNGTGIHWYVDSFILVT